MDKLVAALAPVFAVGFAVQQLIEISIPVVEKIKINKKAFLSCISLIIGLILSWGAGIRVLQPLGLNSPTSIDVIITGLIVSGGTEGINSIVKLLGYVKEKQKQ